MSSNNESNIIAEIHAEVEKASTTALVKDIARASLPDTGVEIGIATGTVIGSMFIKAALTPPAVTGLAASAPILATGLIAAGVTGLALSIFKAPESYKELGRRALTSTKNTTTNTADATYKKLEAILEAGKKRLNKDHYGDATPEQQEQWASENPDLMQQEWAKEQNTAK